jgi:hypothetical protein
MARVTPGIPPGGRVILDTGPLLAWVRGDDFVRAVIRLAAQHKALVVVPTVVVAQVFRGGPTDAPINRLLKFVEKVSDATLPIAQQAGVLLGATRTVDVVDAIVAAEALQALPAVILTSDPGDLRALVQSDSAHPRVQVVPV